MKFTRLIKRRSKTYKIKKKTGELNGPNWEESDPVEYELEAAIFPLTAEDIEKYEGLGYTTQDIKIFIPVPEEDLERNDSPVKVINLETEVEEKVIINENDEITFRGNDYVFDTLHDRTTHADFIKWIAVRDQESDRQ